MPHVYARIHTRTFVHVHCHTHTSGQELLESCSEEVRMLMREARSKQLAAGVPDFEFKCNIGLISMVGE